ncbi:hypothetical protein NNC19_13535 [Clostridium sp. SHJSY1]|nr:hypothetical protein [Clostridium sp. SHJSY1]
MDKIEPNNSDIGEIYVDTIPNHENKNVTTEPKGIMTDSILLTFNKYFSVLKSSISLIVLAL